MRVIICESKPSSINPWGYDMTIKDVHGAYKAGLSLISCVLVNLIFAGSGLFAQAPSSLPENPIIWADVPDPSVIRVNDTYYMSSTTMHMNPGVPIMKSDDLVNWEIISYAYDILTENDAFLLNNGENAYGNGSWASSLKYHEGTYYLATFSYSTGETYIFQTNDIENDSWTRYSIDRALHDPSLFFNNGQVFLLHGRDNIQIIELTEDATALRTGGIDQILIPDADGIAGNDFIVPAEGAHIQKIDGKYFVSLITWPQGSMRTQLIYRADSLFGDYTGKIALEDRGIAQGGLIDTPEGDWYAFLFRDFGSVGRIPYLVPVNWEEGWPVLGEDGSVPTNLEIEAESQGISGIVASDEFNIPTEKSDDDSILRGLSLVWQWNHNPVDEYWSITERPGYLRLKNKEMDSSFLNTKNTLTQRTFGPECTGTVLMDVSRMKEGDYAGLGALQENYGFIGVKMTAGKKSLVMAKGSSESYNEIETISLEQDTIFLKASFDFKNRTDKGYFYFSLDGDTWQPAGNALEMSYTLPHFMGYRFALFSHATAMAGGYADFDYFRVEDTLFDLQATSSVNHENTHPKRFHIEANYPNPFNPTTQISYDIEQHTNVRIDVFDVVGRQVTSLVNEFKSPGSYTVTFNANNLASGIYLYRMQAGNYIKTRQMTLIK